MNTTAEYLIHKRRRIRAGQRRRDRAEDDFKAARVLAARHGLRLSMHDTTHYALEHMRQLWLLNIYPGNRRLYKDENRPTRGPFLRVPTDWTLIDVVETAIAAEETSS